MVDLEIASSATAHEVDIEFALSNFVLIFQNPKMICRTILSQVRLVLCINGQYAEYSRDSAMHRGLREQSPLISPNLISRASHLHNYDFCLQKQERQ